MCDVCLLGNADVFALQCLLAKKIFFAPVYFGWHYNL